MIHIEVKQTIVNDEISLGTEVENNEDIIKKIEELRNVFHKYLDTTTD